MPTSGSEHAGRRSPQAMTDRSIFLIGMKGAGKTTTGRWLGKYLGWTWVDLDHVLEAEVGLPCKAIIRQFGWEEFRRRELQALKNTMDSKPRAHVVSCGGGIVETAEARNLLKAWHDVGIVLHVHRDTEQIFKYLMVEGIRPNYPEEVLDVYERRRSWFEECSNACYVSPHSEHVDVEGEIPQHFRSFISSLQESQKLHEPQNLDHGSPRMIR
jgi:pentafunctional AROM polypeptide